MSNLIATVSEIKTHDMLHIVEFKCQKKSLYMMSLDLTDDITIGKKVKLTIKPSHIAVAKDFTGEISYSNKLDCTIISIENGKLLSSLKLDFLGFILESIITLNSSKSMNLKEGDRVTAMVKASELSIIEVL